MKLNKDTRYLVQEGTLLKGYNKRYIVTTIDATPNGANVTLQDEDTGRKIYGEPLSKCYGMEIEKATGYRHYMIEGTNEVGDTWMFYESEDYEHSKQVYNNILLPQNYNTVQLVGTNEDVDTYLTADTILTRLN